MTRSPRVHGPVLRLALPMLHNVHTHNLLQYHRGDRPPGVAIHTRSGVQLRDIGPPTSVAEPVTSEALGHVIQGVGLDAPEAVLALGGILRSEAGDAPTLPFEQHQLIHGNQAVARLWLLAGLEPALVQFGPVHRPASGANPVLRVPDLPPPLDLQPVMGRLAAVPVAAPLADAGEAHHVLGLGADQRGGVGPHGLAELTGLDRGGRVGQPTSQANPIPQLHPVVSAGEIGDPVHELAPSRFAGLLLQGGGA
mmetsp:Transcript_54725/g.124562  ORF Transcript_54725/g.124562 Transcript_54725/m.124562 type:complete len:252 (-) Transcript_54725:767-1522(-)